MGRPWGQLVGCSVLASSVEEPVDFGGLEGLVDLDGGVAGDAGGDAAAAGFGVFGLLVAVGDGEDLFEHAFELDGLRGRRGRL